jgi:hypothetical protein
VYVFPMFYLYFRLCICVYLDVTYVFTRMLQVFYLDIAYVCNGFHVFFTCFVSVLDICFKCFIYLLLYVVNIVSGCLKSRLSVASPLPSAASPWCLFLALCCLAPFSVCGGGAARADAGGVPRDGGADSSARSSLPLHGQVVLQFTFSYYTRGC